MLDLDGIDVLADIPRMGRTRFGNQTAQVFEDRRTSYAQLDDYASQVANGMIGLDIKPDDRVGFMGKNSDWYFEIMLGSAKASAVMVGVNWRLAGPEVEYVLNDAGVEVLFVGAEFYDLVESVKAGCPQLRQIIAVDGGHSEWQSYVDWRDAQDVTDPRLNIAGDADVIQLYTSGTTGHPKGVQLTNDNYLAVFEQVVEAGWAAWESGKANLVAMPTFHVAGVNVGVLGLAQGSENIILKDVDPTVIIDLIETHKIAYCFIVPAVILFLMQHPRINEADLSSLEMILYGASPIAQDLLESAQARFPDTKFLQVYGLTETTGGGTTLPPEAHDPALGKLRSCGKPNPGMEARIIDEEGNELPQGEVGEIILRSKSIMKGYWNRQEATETAIRDSWFYTGDAGYFDEDGYLYIHDRVKDMIVSGGENVYPAEVENALFGHEKIADVAVIGVPSEKWGEAVKAVVVVAPGEELTEEEIIAYSKERIAGYKTPKSIDFIDALPRNPSGKILRRELRDPYWEGLDRKVN